MDHVNDNSFSDVANISVVDSHVLRVFTNENAIISKSEVNCNAYYDSGMGG